MVIEYEMIKLNRLMWTILLIDLAFLLRLHWRGQIYRILSRYQKAKILSQTKSHRMSDAISTGSVRDRPCTRRPALIGQVSSSCGQILQENNARQGDNTSRATFLLAATILFVIELSFEMAGASTHSALLGSMVWSLICRDKRCPAILAHLKSCWSAAA
jgi:hypothetical protein